MGGRGGASGGRGGGRHSRLDPRYQTPPSRPDGRGYNHTNHDHRKSPDVRTARKAAPGEDKSEVVLVYFVTHNIVDGQVKSYRTVCLKEMKKKC